MKYAIIAAAMLMSCGTKKEKQNVIVIHDTITVRDTVRLRDTVIIKKYGKVKTLHIGQHTIQSVNQTGGQIGETIINNAVISSPSIIGGINSTINR